MILPFLIRTRLGTGPLVLRRLFAGLLLVRRRVIQIFRGRSPNRRVLFIFGCQRSGTTVLGQVFEGDARVTPFAEHSNKLSRPDHPIRIRPLDQVEAVFDHVGGDLIVAKPIVESHRVLEFLSRFPSAKAIWMYRDYRDVVRSYVKLFGRAGTNNLAKILENKPSWVSEDVSAVSRSLVERFYRDDMSPFDAAAVFWLVRNQLYFDQELFEQPDVLVCRYASLVTHPDDTMRSIYQFVGLSYPGSHLVGGIHRTSRGLGRDVKIAPELRALCDDMLSRLDTIAQTSMVS